MSGLGSRPSRFPVAVQGVRYTPFRARRAHPRVAANPPRRPGRRLFHNRRSSAGWGGGAVALARGERGGRLWESQARGRPSPTASQRTQCPGTNAYQTAARRRQAPTPEGASPAPTPPRCGAPVPPCLLHGELASDCGLVSPGSHEMPSVTATSARGERHAPLQQRAGLCGETDGRFVYRAG